MYRPAAAHRIVILVTYSNMFYSYIMEIRLNSLVAYIYGLRHRQGKQAFFSFEHILLISSKGLGTSSNNLLF